jgi:hypothetical protein
MPVMRTKIRQNPHLHFFILFLLEETVFSKSNHRGDREYIDLAGNNRKISLLTNALNALTQLQFPLPSWERARVRGTGIVEAYFTLTPPLSPHREREPNVKIFFTFVLVTL